MKKLLEFVLTYILIMADYKKCSANEEKEEIYVDYSNQSLTEDNSYEYLMLKQYILLGWVSFFIVLIGISGNVFAIKVLMHTSMLSAIDIHFIGLSLSDAISLILILFTIPLRYILVSHSVLWYLIMK